MANRQIRKFRRFEESSFIVYSRVFVCLAIPQNADSKSWNTFDTFAIRKSELRQEAVKSRGECRKGQLIDCGSTPLQAPLLSVCCEAASQPTGWPDRRPHILAPPSRKVVVVSLVVEQKTKNESK